MDSCRKVNIGDHPCSCDVFYIHIGTCSTYLFGTHKFGTCRVQNMNNVLVGVLVNSTIIGDKQMANCHIIISSAKYLLICKILAMITKQFG